MPPSGGVYLNRNAKILSYLQEEMEREERLVDPRLRFLVRKAQEFYWTVSRWAGLSRLHDGQWRKPSGREAESLRVALAGDIPAPRETGRLLIDVTATHRYRRHTGVQRVVREISRAAVVSGEGLPVFIEEGRLFSHFKHDRLPFEIEPRAGDKLLLLDSGWGFFHEYPPVLRAARQAGTQVVGCLYDLIPLRFPAAAEAANGRAFAAWFEKVLLECGAIVCISKSVAEDFVAYLRETGRAAPESFRIGWWPLGADFGVPAEAAPSPAARELAGSQRPFFMSVGTLEPRKAYPVALDAFEKLWAQGCDASYVIVGRRGWNTRALERRILRHAEYGRRLFWLDNASDADLFHLYPLARALVFPSFVEGFGMPLVEALRHGARVIASDIPVFREIGRDDVAYFDLLDAGSLAARIREALSSDHVAARRPEVIGWAESAATLTRLIQRDAYQLRPATQLLDETGERDCA